LNFLSLATISTGSAPVDTLLFAKYREITGAPNMSAIKMADFLMTAWIEQAVLPLLRLHYRPRQWYPSTPS
jgi:hypothetical protein